MSWSFREPTVLFGGSFDPIHEGHLHVARAVKAQLPQIKNFVFVPAAHSPGKPAALASAADRLHWLKLVAEPEGFHVWDYDLERSGESYTVETLEEAHRQGATRERLFWLVGADAYAGFSRWKNPARIRELSRLLVVNRPGEEISPQSSDDQIISIAPHPASSTEIREALARGENPLWLPPAAANLLLSAKAYVRKK